MSKKYTGGPAFPAEEDIDYPSMTATEKHTGMSLRDYFAAKAMHALMTEPIPDGNASLICNWTKNTKLTGPKKFAFAAYLMADAMLEARDN